MKKMLLSILIAVMTVLPLLTPPPAAAAGDGNGEPEGAWNIIDEGFESESGGWTINSGRNAEGTVTYGDGVVTIDNPKASGTNAFYYLIKNNFDVTDSEFTFESKVKVNADSTANEIGVRINGKVVSIFLHRSGDTGIVQNLMQSPTKTTTVDVGQYHTYRVTVKANSTFDVYVDGVFAWSDAVKSATGGNLIKLGAESPVTANMEVDYFRMNDGVIVPESGDPTDPTDPTDPLPAPEFPYFRYEGVIIDPANMKYKPTNEYDFPTIIRAEDYFDNPLGKYYLYYGPHDYPGGISLAYADTLEGPWHEYEANPIISNKWDPYYSVTHVASAHPIWMEQEGKLFLYFHGENHTTRLATSTDGIHFQYEGVMVTTADFDGINVASYARVFEYEIPGRNNKYIMLLMGYNKANQIYLAWSKDGREWETQRTPIITPQKNERIDQGGSLSGPYYFPWEGRHFVSIHAASGHQYMVEVGERFDQEIHYEPFNEAMAGYPDFGRAASRSFIQEGDTLYMVYEAGQRGNTVIALAKSVPRENLLKIYEVLIGIQSTTISKGGSYPLEIVSKRYNHDVIDPNDVEITYFSSDENVATVADGALHAREAGTAEVWVKATYEGLTVQSKRLNIEVREESTWDIIDETFDDYRIAWAVSKGAAATGSVTQGDGVVTLEESRFGVTGSYHYLTRKNFFVPQSDYTFEVRTKVNGPSTGNEYGVRVNNRLVSFFLTYDGQSGYVQDRISNPTRRLAIDTSEYHAYRVIVREDYSFDLYVDGELAWSGNSVSQSDPNLVKVGSDTPATTNMEIDYFKMNVGALVPDQEEPPLEPQDPPAGLTGAAPTGSANNDGVIRGVVIGMEYKRAGADSYSPVLGTTIEGLEPGTYQVRYAAREGYSASPDVEVVVPAYVKPTPDPEEPTLPPNDPTPADPTPADPTPDTPEPGDPDDDSEVLFNSDMIDPEKIVARFREQLAATVGQIGVEGYSDINGHWAMKQIGLFSRLEGIRGYQDGTVRGNATMTRAEFAAMLVQLLEIENTGKKAWSLSDIESHWASSAIATLAGHGVINGYTDGTFRPNETISRQEMVTMLLKLVRAEALPKQHKADFVDGNAVSSFAVKPVQLAAEAGIIQGYADGTFRPSQNVSRAEAVVMTLNLLQLEPRLHALLDPELK